jgi:hypothetical protein
MGLLAGQQPAGGWRRGQAWCAAAAEGAAAAAVSHKFPRPPSHPPPRARSCWRLLRSPRGPCRRRGRPRRRWAPPARARRQRCRRQRRRLAPRPPRPLAPRPWARPRPRPPRQARPPPARWRQEQQPRRPGAAPAPLQPRGRRAADGSSRRSRPCGWRGFGARAPRAVGARLQHRAGGSGRSGTAAGLLTLRLQRVAAPECPGAACGTPQPAPAGVKVAVASYFWDSDSLILIIQVRTRETTPIRRIWAVPFPSLWHAVARPARRANAYRSTVKLCNVDTHRGAPFPAPARPAGRARGVSPNGRQRAHRQRARTAVLVPHPAARRGGTLRDQLHAQTTCPVSHSV